MANLRFKIGDIVEFTFSGPYPSGKKWLKGQNTGRGVVLDYNNKKNKYLVEITYPANFNLGFSYLGSSPNKVWSFEEGALKPAGGANIGDDDTQPIYFLPPPKEKPKEKKKDDAKKDKAQEIIEFFKGKKDEGDGRLCPNPKCRAKMIPLATGYCCPNGCDKKKPNGSDEKK
jgi:hypothetical protein